MPAPPLVLGVAELREESVAIDFVHSSSLSTVSTLWITPLFSRKLPLIQGTYPASKGGIGPYYKVAVKFTVSQRICRFAEAEMEQTSRATKLRAAYENVGD